jgi:hypothetical protein
MEPPPTMFDKNGKPPCDPRSGEPLVCQIKKGIYGLKQSGYAWAHTFKDFMLSDPEYDMGFSQMTGEANLYHKKWMLNGQLSEVDVGQYVDDCLVVASSEEAKSWFMDKLGSRFPVNPSSSGEVSVESPGLLLSIQLYYDRTKGKLILNQKSSIEALARKWNLHNQSDHKTLPINPQGHLPKLNAPEDGVSVKDYLSIIGSCLYIAQVSRPDCAYAVGVLSRHSSAPGSQHLAAAKSLISYLYSTRDWSIQYSRTDDAAGNIPQIFSQGCRLDPPIEERLVAAVPNPPPNSPTVYCDADLAGDKISRRSTTGMYISMNGGPISWLSRLQKLCAQSSAESEIYAVTESVKEAIHLKLLCEECGIRLPNIPMTIWEDNNACIQMGHALRGSNAAKHFEIRLRFLYEHIAERNIQFSRIDTKDQIADGFTKPLPRPAFELFRSRMLVNPTSSSSSSTSTSN